MEEAVNGDRLKMRQDVVVTRVYFFLCEREIPLDEDGDGIILRHGASLDGVFVLPNLIFLALLTWRNVAMLQVRERSISSPLSGDRRHSAALPAILRVSARAGFTITRSSAKPVIIP